ncbi:hypothetical protein E2562_000057 [Oryza meyeriana var. granulata]|uniref:Uncharacterized protein n=1 Tax=Oryza meyeriana var. granulata TaxID=110450 RepID=A0A6G1DDC8_9ORYZ|nr:hypothetical protein E2562_000057 [Oryza meyeriana var. granulata]
MNGDSPVMTESERRAYRYGQATASPRLRGLGQLGGMRKSWSNDSLSSYGGGGGGRAGGAQACVCAPTTHPGSFRCKHHRHASNLGAAAPAQEADADGKHQEAQEQEVSSAEQERAT